MTNTQDKQASLFDAEKPRAIECAGGELSPLIADLRARGAVVLGMTTIRNATYRLALFWPDQAKPAFRVNPR
jgi:hypothetical protein